MIRWLPPALLVLLSGLLSPHLPRPAGGVSTDIRRKDSKEIDQSAIGKVLGEFRTGLSDILYVKADRYMHGGVIMAEHAHGADAVAQGETEELHTQRHDDFRGWIGDLHRAVEPRLPPGSPHPEHQEDELIPLFRMMTLLDGGYIQGYQAGAFWIAQINSEAALEFLQEGLDRNPESFQLYLQMGLTHLQMSRTDSEEDASHHRDQAAQAFHQAARFAIQSAGEEQENVYAKSDAWQATGLSFAIELRHGDPEKAEERRQRYLQTFPDNPALLRAPEP